MAGRIDAQRMVRNILMTGPATAIKVQAMADAMLSKVDTSRLKRDHVQAVEVIFGLPSDTAIQPEDYFARCMQWLRDAMPMPVLLATAHHDEAAPHFHVLMLPIQAGKHIGGALIDREKLRYLRESFFTQVAGPAGLQRQGAKLRGQAKRWAAEAVLRVCEEYCLPESMGPLWAVFRASIEREPTPHLLALGIDANATRPTAETPNSSPIALVSSPIALECEVQKIQGLSCVALAHRSPTKEPQNAVETLAELSALVGCKVRVKPDDRVKVARAAEQRAIERQTSRSRPDPSLPTARMDEDGLTRVRDEYAHDLSAWE